MLLDCKKPANRARLVRGWFAACRHGPSRGFLSFDGPILSLDSWKGIMFKLFRREQAEAAVIIEVPFIDSEQIALDMGISAKGAASGMSNEPPSDSVDQDLNEQAISSKIGDIFQEGLKKFRKTKSELEGDFAKSSKIIVSDFEDKIGEILIQCESRMNEIVANWTSDWRKLNNEKNERINEMNDFKKQNHLKGQAYTPKYINIISVMFIIFSIETIVNGFLFAEISSTGISGGWAIAALISFINIAFNVIFGFGFRMHNYIFVKIKAVWKIVGYFLMIFAILFSFIFNLLVANFRDAVEVYYTPLISTTELMIQTFEYIYSKTWSEFFVFSGYESAILFLLGILVSIIAFFEGYRLSDPYPGFSAIADKVSEVEERISLFRSTTNEEIQKCAKDSMRDLTIESNQSKFILSNLEDIVSRQKQVNIELESFHYNCESALNNLLRVYRQSNVESRRDKPPAYFQINSKLSSIENEEVLENNMDVIDQRKYQGDVIKLVSKATVKIEEFKSESLMEISRDMGAFSNILGDKKLLTNVSTDNSTILTK